MEDIEPDLAICLIHNPAHPEGLFPFLDALLLHADPVALEIIVVAGHPDHPALARLERNFPEVIILENSAADHPAKARNHACRLAKARYLSFWDETLLPRPGSLGALIRFLDENPEAGLIAPRIVDAHGMVQPSVRSTPSLAAILCLHTPLGHLLPSAPRILRQHLLLEHDHLRSFEPEWLLDTCLVIRREVLEDIGLLDEGFTAHYADADYCLRARRAGWHLHYLAEAVMLQTRAESPLAPTPLSTPRLMGDCTRLLLKKWLRPAHLPG
ncbi:MAG: glycosyltransferase [Desulfobulbaceae bacterium]|nr:glycosyltransferase [Desulfobulbaceae bacterium]HIJ89366.1 glycosyltransferase [Deltaproteobacteria bacterium]